MAPIAILISGRGSNMQALVAAVQSGVLAADVRVVLSNHADALGLGWARAHGIPTQVLSHREFGERRAYDRALIDVLHSAGVEWICLAGFMRLLGPVACEAFPQRILNIHPSLLPSFPGVDAQAQALAHGVTVTGATVHFVTPELDAGPIVMQMPVLVEPEDTVERLSARILAAEHQLYPRALAAVLAGGWRVEGRRVRGLSLGSYRG